MIGVWCMLLTYGRGETLTVATYNVENYVPADRMTAAGYRKDYPKPEVQKRALREVIMGLNADVLVLQEMGPAEYLEELRRDLKRDRHDYAHAELLVAADAERHVAVLSKRPLVSVVKHTNVEFGYRGTKERVKRGVLEVQIATSAGNVTLFAVHLKSRFTDHEDDPQSAERRLSEATAVRDLVAKRFPDASGALFLILGDFNDDKSSKTLRRLTHRGNQRITTLLPALDSRGDTWTHAYRKQDSYSRVDHVLASVTLLRFLAGAKAQIYDGPGARDASDHRPVAATFVFGGAK